MRLYFIRHGQSSNNLLWDQTGSDTGRSDDPLLTEKGRKQAECAGVWLQEHADPWDGLAGRSGYQITHLYSSPMRRAISTAVAISNAIGLPIVLWKDWHECGGIYLHDHVTGKYQIRSGITSVELETIYPNVICGDAGNPDGWYNRPMENEKECGERAKRVLSQLIKRHADTDDRVAIVSHGGFYVKFISALVRKEKLNPVWFLMNNTGITRFDFNGKEQTVAYQNSIFHLPPELIS
jgi:2,3-bisphosphoglycerate-dependent phosphoglycerate mutase